MKTGAAKPTCNSSLRLTAVTVPAPSARKVCCEIFLLCIVTAVLTNPSRLGSPWASAPGSRKRLR